MVAWQFGDHCHRPNYSWLFSQRRSLMKHATTTIIAILHFFERSPLLALCKEADRGKQLVEEN
jgi:hypothetical protein